MKILILVCFLFTGCANKAVSEEFFDASPFRYDFTVGVTDYAILAPDTPGVGHFIVCVKRVEDHWEIYYGQGRDVNYSEIDSRGGMSAYVQLHLNEINRLLAVDHETDGTEITHTVFSELYDFLVNRVFIDGNKLVIL